MSQDDQHGDDSQPEPVDGDSTHLDDNDSVNDGHDNTAFENDPIDAEDSDATQLDDAAESEDESFVDSETVADDTLPNPDDQAVVDQTLFDPNSSVERNVSEEGQTVNEEDQTIPDKTTPPLADASNGDTDDATVVDEPDADEADEAQFAQTVGDPQLMNDDSSEGNDDQQAQVIADQESDFDQTVVQPSSQESLVDKPDNDATQIESMDDGPDATQLEGDDLDATQMQGDGSAGYESFDADTQIPSDPNADYSNDQTQIPGNQGTQFKGKKKKAPHETADRWEMQQRYELVTNFARGGLGKIWLAQDVRLKREVAFKELLPNSLRNSSALERFLEEAQITGQLEHPGIVPIYDIGYQANGTPFYSMKLVRGETMEHYIDELHKLDPDSSERTLQFRKLLRSFIDICNAMAFAHDRGVLHRDLKPLNVMIGAFGETLVLDWGLAKIVGTDNLAEEQTPLGTSAGNAGENDETVVEDQSENFPESTGGAINASNVVTAPPAAEDESGATVASSEGSVSLVDPNQSQGGSVGSTRRMVVTDVRTAGSQTMTGSIMGTPSYMPPEQARGDIDDLDARCDIYALGGILYKLLTNYQPVGRGKIQQVLKDVIEGNIVAPRKRDPSIDKPLEAVCMKALATEVADRYDSALVLASDVESWLADEPVSVFEEPFLVRFRRWRKKHRTAVTSSTVGVALLLVTWLGSIWSHNRAMDDIRSKVATNKTLSQTAVEQQNFATAKDEINEAIGRVSDESDLADLEESLRSNLNVIEVRRVDALRRSITTALGNATTLKEKGDYDNADISLAELMVRLDDEEALNDIKIKVVLLSEEVKGVLNSRAAIATAAEDFAEFEKLVDNARFYSNVEALNPLADDDARTGLEFVTQALETYDLKSGQPPKLTHFERELAWTKEYFANAGIWPDDAVKNAQFNMLVAKATLNVHLARNAEVGVKKTEVRNAINDLQKAEQLGIGDYAAKLTQAALHESIGEDKEAQTISVELQETGPTTFHDFFLLGSNERIRLLTDSAIKNYEQALAINPGDLWTQQDLALCHVRLGQYSTALAYLTNCITQRPNSGWLRIQRGLCYLKMNKPKEAIAEFEVAKQDELQKKGVSNLFNVYVNRGATYVVMGELKKALADFVDAAALDAQSAMPLINMAYVHLETAKKIRQGRDEFKELEPLERQQKETASIQLAIDELSKAEKVSPQNASLHSLRGEALQMQDLDAQAKISYELSAKFERDPIRKCDTLKKIAMLEFRDQEYLKARGLFEEARRANPKDVEPLFYIAECYLNLARSAKDKAAKITAASSAMTHYSQFSKESTVDISQKFSAPEVLFNGMALAYSQLGKQPETMQYYSLALMFNAGHAHSLTRRGWSYVMNSMSLAESDFLAAIKSDPDNADAQIGLAYVLIQKGKLPEGLAAVEQGVTKANVIIDRELEQKPLDGERLAELFKLLHNAATVYAQAVIREPDAAKQKELATKSLDQLKAAYVVARKGNAQRLMLTYMLQDTALNPLKIKARVEFVELFNRLKNDMP